MWGLASRSSAWWRSLGDRGAVSFVLRPGSTDQLVYEETFEGKYHVPPSWMPVPSSVLDLGANIGLVGAHYRELWPEADVVMVEMDLDNSRVAFMNNPGGKVLHQAVAGRTGRRSYRRFGQEYAYRLGDAGDGVAVAAESLQSLIDRVFSGHVDFCKMDVEGTEWELFATAGAWAPMMDYLLVELHGPDPLLKAGELLAPFFASIELHQPHPQALFCWHEAVA